MFRRFATALWFVGASSAQAVPIGGEPSAIESGLASRSDILFYLAYNATNWAPLLGTSTSLDPDLTQTPDGFEGTGMNVFLKQGTIGATGNGDSGTYFTLQKAGVDEPLHDEMYFRYYFKADPDFPYVQGGKIPGMCAHKDYGGGVNPPPGEGWSARYMWDKSGELYLYAYTQSNTGWGAVSLTNHNGRRAQILPGKWHCLEQYIKLNSVGQANGKVHTWLDGNLVLQRDDMEIITAAGTGAKLNWNREFGSQFQCFYGGGDSAWAPPRDTWMRFDNVVLAKNPIGPKTGAGVCSQPAITTPGGTYTNKVMVTLSADAGDTIRFTTNGLEPTYYSQAYTAPVWISKSCTFKARAFNDAKPYSPVATTSYTITNPAIPVALVPITPSADSFVRDSGTFTYGNINYGTETTMALLNASNGFERRILVKFPLSPVAQPAAAKIRLYFGAVASTPTPVVLWEMPVGTWTNTSVTWNNRPQEGDLLDTRRTVSAIGWQEWDVSNSVSAALARGDSSIAFTVVALEPANIPLSVNSREHSSNKPQLVISTYPADAAAPGWTPGFPKAESPDPESLILRASLGEAGTVHYVLLAAGSAAPSVAQVIAGQDSAGATALHAGSFTVTASNEGTATLSGLSATTAYDIHCVAQDLESPPNIQNAVSMVTAATINPDAVMIHEPFAYPIGTDNPDPDGGSNSGSGLPATNAGGNPTGTSTGLRGFWGTTLDVVEGLTYPGLATSGGAGAPNNAAWGTGSCNPYRSMTTDPHLAYREGGSNTGNFGADGKTLYVSVLMKLGAGFNSTTVARFAIGAAEASGNIYVGANIGDNDPTPNWGISRGSTGTIANSTAAAVAGGTALLVLRYTFGASNADSVDLWVNPQLAQPLGSPAASLSGGDFAITGLNTRPDTAGAFILDEFRIAASPQAVMPASPADNYTSWANTNGATGGANGDPDGDGLKNLIEYALGGNPASAASGTNLLPTASTTTVSGHQRLTLTFTPRKTDVSYFVEGSGNLASWPDVTPISPVTPDVQVIHTDGVEMDSMTKRFLRLRVTSP